MLLPPCQPVDFVTGALEIEGVDNWPKQQEPVSGVCAILLHTLVLHGIETARSHRVCQLWLAQLSWVI